MADAKTRARKRFAKVARKLAGLCSTLLAEERSLSASSGLGADREAEQLGAAASCVVVDSLEPAIKALERAAQAKPVEPGPGEAED